MHFYSIQKFNQMLITNIIVSFFSVLIPSDLMAVRVSYVCIMYVTERLEQDPSAFKFLLYDLLGQGSDFEPFFYRHVPKFVPNKKVIYFVVYRLVFNWTLSIFTINLV